MNKYQTIAVIPIAGSLGAEIQGVDLGAHVPGEVLNDIRQAFLDHLVIFFSNQDLTPEKLLAFAKLFGQPIEYPQMKGIQESPFITSVTKLEHEKINFGGVWHSDTSYLDRPPSASMLYAVETPPVGGDTIFANQYLAYEKLSVGFQKAIADLVGVNISTKAQVSRTRKNRLNEAGEKLKSMKARHPVVRTHPETGRKGLYVNFGHTSHFDGWTEEESRPLLEYLFEFQTRPEFTCRYRWNKGSLAIWDNRCSQHNPVNDYQGFRRTMHRISLAGDKPF